MTDFAMFPFNLAADFDRVGEEVNIVLASSADISHFDVTDSHYASNVTIGPLGYEAVRKHGVTTPIDVHLMSGRWIASFRISPRRTPPT